MDPSNPYFRQVQLLVSVIPVVAKQECFALKGGTAINLFVRELPRLSVDIDLVYLPKQERNDALAGIDAGLNAIQLELSKRPGHRVSPVILAGDGSDIRLIVETENSTIKIEVNPVLRETVHTPKLSRVRESVESLFGFAEMPVVDFNDLYAGKLCAALDRQHPRDLFDTMQLLESDGISTELKNAFLVYLLSHPRPIAEVLAPNHSDIESVYENEFRGMTTDPIELDALLQARVDVIDEIHKKLTDEDREFLLSFKSGKPDWSSFAYPEVQNMPAIRWKLFNIGKMKPAKHRAACEKLASVLANTNSK
jgi:predicted nucleotidyltransferase component of viral defense system